MHRPGTCPRCRCVADSRRFAQIRQPHAAQRALVHLKGVTKAGKVCRTRNPRGGNQSASRRSQRLDGAGVQADRADGAGIFRAGAGAHHFLRGLALYREARQRRSGNEIPARGCPGRGGARPALPGQCQSPGRAARSVRGVGSSRPGRFPALSVELPSPPALHGRAAGVLRALRSPRGEGRIREQRAPRSNPGHTRFSGLQDQAPRRARGLFRRDLHRAAGRQRAGTRFRRVLRSAAAPCRRARP